MRLAIAGHDAWLDIDDKTLQQHKDKLEARLLETNHQITRLEGRLGNDSYVKNAPEAVVQQTREQLAQQQTIESRLVRELEVLR
jgi:valyl-tRNA synthetase